MDGSMDMTTDSNNLEQDCCPSKPEVGLNIKGSLDEQAQEEFRYNLFGYYYFEYYYVLSRAK